MPALDTLKSFDINNLPGLDVAVMGALEMLRDAALPSAEVPYSRPLVIGSAGAGFASKVLFQDIDAVFADESNFEAALERVPDIDGAVLVSASGSKHAINIAERLRELELSAILFTNNPDAPAASFFAPESVRIFPKNREPYTYNTSTYLSMIIAKTAENPAVILEHIESTNLTSIDLSRFSGFTFILDEKIAVVAPMFRIKFEELFGAKLCARFFTLEESKHAKTVVPDEKELFVYLGTEVLPWANEEGRVVELSLPEGGREASALSVGYHFIGQIQAAHPPYFQQNLVRYCEEASEIFGQQINPIVE